MTAEEYVEQLREFYGTKYCFICNPIKDSKRRELCDGCKRLFRLLDSGRNNL